MPVQTRINGLERPFCKKIDDFVSLMARNGGLQTSKLIHMSENHYKRFYTCMDRHCNRFNYDTNDRS